VMHILVCNTSNSPPARIPLMLSAVTPTILFLSLLSIIIYSRLIIETRSHSDGGRGYRDCDDTSFQIQVPDKISWRQHTSLEPTILCPALQGTNPPCSSYSIHHIVFPSRPHTFHCSIHLFPIYTVLPLPGGVPILVILSL
jgi:hypothetical protein